MSASPSKPVQFKIGNERLIKLLPGATQKLSSLLEKQGRAEHGALRVAVVGQALALANWLGAAKVCLGFLIVKECNRLDEAAEGSFQHHSFAGGTGISE